MRALGRHADTLTGVLIGQFGPWFFWEAIELREGPGYAVGPRVLPLIVGIGLLLSGVAVTIGGLRGEPGPSLRHRRRHRLTEGE